MSNFVVVHTMVGVHRAGDVIEFSKDQVEKLGVDVKRLLRLGAIREATSDESKSVRQYGDTDEEVARVFPAVPYDAVGVSPDPNRGEAAPTNPQEGFVDHAVPIGGTVSDQPRPSKKN